MDTPLANLLKQEQDKRNLRQVEFAKLIGISQPFLCNIYRGERGIKDFQTLRRIAKLTRKPFERVCQLASESEGVK
jgi:transcriptional regulator with XRE-family HTH domain